MSTALDTERGLTPIERIIIGERTRRDMGDIPALAASIAAVGLLHPVVINTNDRLVAGLRGIRAAERLGWLRGQTEHCILAVHGKPVVALTNQTTLVHAPQRTHSQKPEEFYELVESL